jgi:hypothetical protein
MKLRLLLFLSGLLFVARQSATAETGHLTVPDSVQAGAAFSIQTSGSGDATLYIVGFGKALKRSVHLGEAVSYPPGSLLDAGRYVAILEQGPTVEDEPFNVTPLSAPASLSFLAKPSRLPVSLHNGITGAVYVFDIYGNLMLAPTPASFELVTPSGTVQRESAVTRDGAAWAEMDSTGNQGVAHFVAHTGGVSSERVIRQEPGDPCSLKMSAQTAGQQIQLQTDPVRDCSGNAVLDGTIVTFSETFAGGQSTVDVPLKHGIAKVEMPVHRGATLTVASGVVLGNQIRWEQ